MTSTKEIVALLRERAGKAGDFIAAKELHAVADEIAALPAPQGGVMRRTEAIEVAAREKAGTR